MSRFGHGPAVQWTRSLAKRSLPVRSPTVRREYVRSTIRNTTRRLSWIQTDTMLRPFFAAVPYDHSLAHSGHRPFTPARSAPGGVFPLPGRTFPSHFGLWLAYTWF